MYLRGLEVSAQYVSGTDKDHAKVSIPHVLLLLEEMCLGGTKGGKKTMPSTLPYPRLHRSSIWVK